MWQVAHGRRAADLDLVIVSFVGPKNLCGVKVFPTILNLPHIAGAPSTHWAIACMEQPSWEIMGSGQDPSRSACLSQRAEGPSPKLLCTNPRVNDLEVGSGRTLAKGISKLIYLIQGFYPHPEVLLWQIVYGNLVIFGIEYRR